MYEWVSLYKEENRIITKANTRGNILKTSKNGDIEGSSGFWNSKLEGIFLTSET